MNDSTFKLRVPTAELERWKMEASAAGLPLSGWIRSRCAERSHAVAGTNVDPPVVEGPVSRLFRERGQ